MESNHGLIVDVGMSRGQDTEFYLNKGFQVLAIEANPLLVSEVSERLSHHINTGLLQVANVAIAEQPGEVEFFASENDAWGSVRRDLGRVAP